MHYMYRASFTPLPLLPELLPPYLKDNSTQRFERNYYDSVRQVERGDNYSSVGRVIRSSLMELRNSDILGQKKLRMLESALLTC